MQTLKQILCMMLLAVLFISPLSFAVDKPITVDRVRWKKSLFTWKDHPDYPEWKNAGIWTEYRKNTFIARYWNPGASQARTLMLLLPGQQGSSGSSGCSNCVAGQGSTWDNGWGNGDKSKSTYIKEHSLAGQLIDSGQFSANDTFIGVVFNSNFNWENTASAKSKAEQAFTNWFLKHGQYPTVNRIILLGSSRGGTLAMRMAKNILQRNGWNTVPVYVGIIDAVPNDVQNELYTANQPKCYNPLNSSYYARRADLAAFFFGLNKPAIRHVVTGAPVILNTAVHAFCADNFGWYNQSWEDLKHTEIGRCNSTEDAPYNANFMDAGIGRLYDWLMNNALY
ncbi:hypothetical protein [Teredinibacter turnerae]|uniref:hypothetical protein n=1 Tax=Teredinibacter turnerae TaxID=2426 RepID=UPI0003A971AD|nr:hypothetical protein [Teredinibacter turnerae]